MPEVSVGRYGKWIFLTASVAVVTGFLYFSNILVKDLSERERERMEIWADATKEILRQFGDAGDVADVEPDNFEVVVTDADGVTTASEPADCTDADVVDPEGGGALEAMPVADIEFLFRIIEGNTTIPVLHTDERGNILNYRNFDLPVTVDASTPYDALPYEDRVYLNDKLDDLRNTSNVIEIELADGVRQYLYYEDSKLLKRLSYFPYIQLAVMLVFLLVVYFAVTSSKQAEQNKVWVGLSKETAHQLGTPISSLMAWMELLPEMGTDPDTCNEMGKDVRRLSTIASRFSKIGSKPTMEPENVANLVTRASDYMASRISSRIDFTRDIRDIELTINASAPLFEWVMENLIKNAVDAMEGHGSIHVAVFETSNRAVIEVTDNGKGIPRKNHKNIFKPGYTTKKRGWGLGLTLAKRIIEQYHRGRIFVKESTPGVGTTFRIELPLRKVDPSMDPPSIKR